MTMIWSDFSVFSQFSGIGESDSKLKSPKLGWNRIRLALVPAASRIEIRKSRIDALAYPLDLLEDALRGGDFDLLHLDVVVALQF